ncbi:MAG: hypothetical protein M1386_05400 [Candidatus Thermoplasmatota archaeon]|jgi:hypothetical protein|nr:hypothetical protein [Candidatus Thermoplasmatota archaeon]
MDRHGERQRTVHKNGISLSERTVNIDNEMFKLVLGLAKGVIQLISIKPDFPTADFVNLATKIAIDSNLTAARNQNGYYH